MKSKKRLVTILSILLAIFAILIILMLMNSKESHTTNENNSSQITSSLVCSFYNPVNSFFNSENADSISEEIKMIFKDNNMDKLFYSFIGKYNSAILAEQDEVELHAKYNKYMGENNYPQDSLSPSYSLSDNKLHITLFADSYKDINTITAKFFSIDKEDIAKVGHLTLEELGQFYKEKGFSCILNNN